MIFPTRAQIVRHNFEVIKATRGFFKPPENLINPNSLDWVLETIQYPLFNQYEAIQEKASLLSWTIIRDHIFFDGNKRTGMISMNSFLTINGYFLVYTSEEIIQIARHVADSNNKESSKQDLVNWIIQHRANY